MSNRLLFISSYKNISVISNWPEKLSKQSFKHILGHPYSPIPEASRCRISALKMVPINFWQNSYLYKRKFFYLKNWYISKKISKNLNIKLWIFLGADKSILCIQMNNVWFNKLPNGYFCWSVTYTLSRAQCEGRWGVFVGFQNIKILNK